MTPSLRLSGLDFAGVMCSRIAAEMLLGLSPRALSRSNLMGSLSSSKRIGAISVSVIVYSFSWSSRDKRGADAPATALTWLLPSLKARRSELFGDVLRALTRIGAFRLRLNLLLFEQSVEAFALNARERADGGDFLGDLVVYSWKRDGLEGERDSERRICLIEGNASMEYCGWVGESRCMPPAER